MQAQEDKAQDAKAPTPTENPAPAPAPSAPEAAAAPQTTAEAPAAPAAPVEAAKEAAPASESPAPAPGPAESSPVDQAIETVPASAPAAGAKPDAAAKQGIPAGWAFLIGLGLLGLFVSYFAAENVRRKRILGTILSVFVAGASVWLFQTLGMEKGIELAGGVSMEIKIRPAEGREVTPHTQDQAIKVLTQRLNALGTADILIAPSGKDGIFLQLPGVEQENLQNIEDTLEQVAHLSFSILHPQSFALAAQVAEGAQVIPGYEALPYAEEKDKDGNVLPTRYGLVKIKRDMEGKHVSRAAYQFIDKGHSISVGFTSEGAKIMGPLTRANQGQPLAIILDDVILSSPVIQEPFADGCSITGSFTQEEALALASALENPLENPIEIEFSNYISPTMGEAAVKQGILSGVWGLGLVLLFMLVYYRFAGLVALVGLSSIVAIVFGTMALFGFTLTLPGIAGIILTIGMAIDANVIIYERLREEMAAGKSLKLAIELAYERAFWSIMDSNLTTLITAIILFYVADGTVKGFAVTLVIGIFGTLFAALVVSRICFQWVMNAKFFTKLTFLNLIPSRSFDFLGVARPWLIGSLALTVLSILVVLVKDPRGVELKGGDSLTIRTAENLSTTRLSESLQKLDLGAEPIVQEQRSMGDDGVFYLVRIPTGTADKALEHLASDLGIDLKDTTVSSVGSAVGKSMLINSALALALGMLGILIYVTLRYEFAFALGAIAALFHDVVVALGIASLLGQELSLITVGALLTIAGYSLNDTIVIFDRVRESLQTKRGDVRELINLALNQTLGRTILTSATTLFTVIVLCVFGGPGLRSFSVTLLIGMITGVYSTLFIASPIVLWWAKRTGTNLRRQVIDTEQAKLEGVTAP